MFGHFKVRPLALSRSYQLEVSVIYVYQNSPAIKSDLVEIAQKAA